MRDAFVRFIGPKESSSLITWEEFDMKRRSFIGVASALAVGLTLSTGAVAQDDDITIALIPGLTTDAFYITMNRGAQAAADALGVELVFQGHPRLLPWRYGVTT